ncbi:hypothetical protein DCJ39_12085, partial [Salmonella enterica subsp. enterica serovar Kentucky]|nr:hypothetical protein [Salmonella enterica subsp. enterica serovar Kentucky]
HAVFLALAYATASSIANVAIRLLKNTIFESFDMPLDVTPEAIAQQVMRYLEEHPLASGVTSSGISNDSKIVFFSSRLATLAILLAVA